MTSKEERKKVALKAREKGIKFVSSLPSGSKMQTDLAQIGLNALIDEATGYQKVRPKDALRKMADELEAPEGQIKNGTLVPDPQYCGRYVALKDCNDNTVVASGNSWASAQTEAIELGFLDAIVVYVPKGEVVHIH
jgi:hypothetical protein